MRILGISCFYHDAASALIEDGRLVAAVEEERFSRIKHDFDFPKRAIEWCLKKARIKAQDLDYVVFYEKPFLKFERILLSNLKTFPKSYFQFREAMPLWLKKKLWIKGLIKQELHYRGEVLFASHHISHAASAFLVSPFEEAAILTADGVGEWTTTALGKGKGNKIVLSKEIRFPHSLGLLYSAFTAFLGFKVNEGEYKVMGMAPYGQPRYVDKILDLINIEDDGSFSLNLDYFSFHYSPAKTFNRKFITRFGRPRTPEEAEHIDPYYADIASSIQKVAEEVLIKIARYLYQETGLKKLCYAGGVALNSVANARILKETPFEEIFIQPSAGDGGGSLGAAIYAYYSLTNEKRKFVLEHAYWGPEFNNGEIKDFLDRKGISYKRLADEKLFPLVARLLTQGKVIGWYQGPLEWGPRALGNRSILADPRKEDMKDIVNSKIKFREPFRPFAPSVLAPHAESFFEIPGKGRRYPLDFMLCTCQVKEEKGSQIPAVTHVNGSARIQMVHQNSNPRYYRLIEAFYRQTGVPVVLNTSFNLRGEPIVLTPRDAFSTFSRSGMDTLVLGNFLIEKGN